MSESYQIILDIWRIKTIKSTDLMRRQKILIADDDSCNLMLYTEMLKSPNYDIVTAYDGVDALEKTFAENPDIIILDWNMPRMDGLEALKKIKSESLYKETPVIIITGIMNSSENLKVALDAGAIDFLRKPFNKVELHARVDSALRFAQNIIELKYTHHRLMESKTKELIFNALKIAHQAELSNSVISDLSEIYVHTNKKGNDLIKQLIGKINFNSNNKIWDEFEAHFENVYENFYEKLDEQFPSLTPGERKLCALLRLNLSSKDIAALTFQNSSSVDMARYRLRKKFNLSKKTNLVDFLLKIDK